MAETTEEILALAPDTASVKAAKGLVVPSKWQTLGHDDGALWGECKGSGSKPYQVQMDRTGPAFKCSCPSRKFPCKHGLALALLHCQQGDRFRPGERPTWVAEWLDSRRTHAERQTESKTKRAATPADPKAAARREAARARRMQEGLGELELWLADRVRQGLAQLPSEPGAWAALAARMVDAQLPGIAYRLHRTAALVGRGAGWPGRVFAEMGRLSLLIEATRRLDDLPPPVQADLRAALGIALGRDRVLADGERIGDDWTVLGVRHEEEDRLRLRRVWLLGRQSARLALLLDYAHGTAPFEPPILAGTTLEATLAFYPGSIPLRALLVDPPRRIGSNAPPLLEPPTTDAWLGLGDRVAANPWQGPLGLIATGIPYPTPDGWSFGIGDGGAVPMLIGDAGWSLVAAAGGAPITCFGEWEGEALRPLSAWAPEPVWLAPGATTG